MAADRLAILEAQVAALLAWKAELDAEREREAQRALRAEVKAARGRHELEAGDVEQTARWWAEVDAAVDRQRQAT